MDFNEELKKLKGKADELFGKTDVDEKFKTQLDDLKARLDAFLEKTDIDDKEKQERQ